MFLFSCATTPKNEITGDIGIVIDTPTKYMTGIPKQQITGHASQVNYKGKILATYSNIIGVYTNDGDSCEIIWRQINPKNGDTISGAHLAYTPCTIKDKFNSGELVAGYNHATVAL